METKYIVIGHGTFPSAMQESVRMITGIEDNLYKVELHADEDANEFEMKLKTCIEPFLDNNKVVIFADLLGGSPSNTALRLYLDHQSVEIYAGVNLPLIISSVLTNSTSSNLEDSRQALVDVKAFVFDDEDM